MSHHCPECDVYWWPYQTKAGRCPQCGGATMRRHEAASEDAVARHQEALAEADRQVLEHRVRGVLRPARAGRLTP